MEAITIEHGDGADLIIDDEMISRRHMVLKYGQGVEKHMKNSLRLV